MAQREEKYVVIKRADASKYLSQPQKDAFNEACLTIQRGRAKDGRLPYNAYVVINQDEPYASAVWDIVIAFENEKERGK